jgi:hypothetical protein
MDDIVAVRATLVDGEKRYLLTWGRLFGAVETQQLIDAVMPHVVRMVRGAVTSVEVCNSLQEASGEPYFFEGLFSFGQTAIPYGPNYDQWVSDMRERVKAGREIYFLGVRGQEPPAEPP